MANNYKTLAGIGSMPLDTLRWPAPLRYLAMAADITTTEDLLEYLVDRLLSKGMSYDEVRQTCLEANALDPLFFGPFELNDLENLPSRQLERHYGATHIRALNATWHAVSLLERHGIRSIKDLMERFGGRPYSPDATWLLRLPGCGKKTAAEIASRLNEYVERTEENYPMLLPYRRFTQQMLTPPNARQATHRPELEE